jgi:hypothetical protein
MHASASEMRSAVDRLISLFPSVDWMLRDEIEGCLVTHFDKVCEVLPLYLREDALSKDPNQIERALLRVRARAADPQRPARHGPRTV